MRVQHCGACTLRWDLSAADAEQGMHAGVLELTAGALMCSFVCTAAGMYVELPLRAAQCRTGLDLLVF